MTEQAEPVPSDVAKMSFEEALGELEKIVGRLEKGNVALEESIAIYSRGDALKKHCDRLLRQAEMRVEKIAADAEGRPTGVEPLDVG